MKTKLKPAPAKLFGTDGVRGIANIPPMTADTALAIGRAAAYVLRKTENRHRPRILIGKDTRLSGYLFENALTAGICSMGADVLLTGPIPTPAIAYIARSMRADAGIVISASHNPFQDNGIKLFSGDGFKIDDALEAEIEAVVADPTRMTDWPEPDAIGRAHRIDDANGRYIEFCKRTFPQDLTLDGLRIVLDCANGATYQIAPIIFRELGADVFAIHHQPNGININDHCGSQHTEDLQAKVHEVRADIGLAFDGDGDRLIVVDEHSRVLSGDHLLAILARDLKASGALENDLVILTPMSNFGLRRALDGMGIRHLDAAVGDRNVLMLMQQQAAVLGGEQSGHIIFRNQHTTGDGIVTALQLLAVMRRSGQAISRLADVFTECPQVLINVPVARKPDLSGVPEIAGALAEAESTLGSDGRVLLRYSGTEAICRVMVEGPDALSVRTLAEGLAAAVRRALG